MIIIPELFSCLSKNRLFNDQEVYELFSTLYTENTLVNVLAPKVNA